MRRPYNNKRFVGEKGGTAYEILGLGRSDVAGERPRGAAPPGNLPAPPGNFAHHTFLGKFKPPTNLVATYKCIVRAGYAPNNKMTSFTYKNSVGTLFSLLKRCVPLWTPHGDFVHLPAYVFWLHPWVAFCMIWN